MIVDVLKNAFLYEGIHPAFLVAVEEAERLAAEKAAPGRYDLPDGAYLMVQGYETTPTDTPTFEAHRAYIDVQIMLNGDEVCYVAERAALAEKQAYTADGDYELLETGDAKGVHKVNLVDGVFAVFFPEDAHAPGIANGEAASVRKIVVKLPA